MSSVDGTSKGTYETSHAWLTFVAKLDRAPPRLWMNLGAIQSKCEHVANVLLPPKVAEAMHTLFLAKGIHATTAIEGNTLSEDEVQAVVQRKPIRTPPSKKYQVREIQNIVVACNEIADRVIDEKAACNLTPKQVMRFNELVLKGLPLEEDVVPGKVRRGSVGVADYRGAPAQDCDYLLARMCDWINGIDPPSEDQTIAFAVIKAVLAHLYIAWIHPFGDGNGRTARLIEVQILLGAGVPTVAAHLLSNHYNQTRPEYYQQLSMSSKSGGDVIPFLDYAVQGLVDGLNAQIERIRELQKELAWRDYVYERFRDKEKSPAARRQREVALALGTHPNDSFSRGAIRRLTPEIAEFYATKTTKTLSRDLNELATKNLIVRVERGLVRANVQRLQAFLPRRRKRSHNSESAAPTMQRIRSSLMPDSGDGDRDQQTDKTR